jgi:hypothetical protein
VGAEDILQEQQGEAGNQKPIHVSAKKAAELFDEAFARIQRSSFTLFR